MPNTRLLPSLNIFRRLVLWMGVAVAYALAVGWIAQFVGSSRWVIGDEAAAILGLPISILLVFRTNAAYDRWWEARKHWGQLVNDTRNLALKARAHACLSETEFKQFGRLLIAFPHALRLHLRGHDVLRDVAGFEDDSTQCSHPPAHIAGLIHESLSRWNREGRLVDTVWVLDVHARSLLDICGACERIRATPLVSSFRSLVRWSILLFVVLAPWSIFLDSGWPDLPLLLIGFVFLFGIEQVAEVVEEPFGTEGDDLPLEQLCDTMESYVRELADLPSPGTSGAVGESR